MNIKSVNITFETFHPGYDFDVDESLVPKFIELVERWNERHYPFFATLSVEDFTNYYDNWVLVLEALEYETGHDVDEV